MLKRATQKNIEICQNGHYVSRASDYVIYSVEAAVIDRVIAQFGPCTRSPICPINAIDWHE